MSTSPPAATDAAGRVWHPYAVEFTSPDGVYLTTLWAISPYHAELQLEALKETGRVKGQITHQSPARKP